MAKTLRCLLLLPLGFAGLAGCNPFAECSDTERPLTEPVVGGVDVEAQAALHLKEFTGELVWYETGHRSPIVMSLQRGEYPAWRDTDCDGTLIGFGIPGVWRVHSGDGLIDSRIDDGINPPYDQQLELHLNRRGQLAWFYPTIQTLTPRFEVLRAAGEVPEKWISGPTPRLELIFEPPDMKPRDTEIVLDLADVGLVPVGSVSFQ
jgi:hypothetical protein